MTNDEQIRLRIFSYHLSKIRRLRRGLKKRDGVHGERTRLACRIPRLAGYARTAQGPQNAGGRPVCRARRTARHARRARSPDAHRSVPYRPVHFERWYHSSFVIRHCKASPLIASSPIARPSSPVAQRLDGVELRRLHRGENPGKHADHDAEAECEDHALHLNDRRIFTRGDGDDDLDEQR